MATSKFDRVWSSSNSVCFNSTFMLFLLAHYNWWIAVLLLLIMVPQSLSYYRIQQKAFETLVTRSKNARKLDYLSSLLLDRKDAKEIRLFNMFPAVIKKYIALFQDTRKDVDQVLKKQMCTSTFFLALVVALSDYGFYWFASSVVHGILGAVALLMFISIVASVSSLATLVEDSSLLYDSLLRVEKYQRFDDYHDDFQSGTKKIVELIKQIKLEHVSFAYPFSKNEVLHDLNSQIKQGEKIAIVGENGSSKSTLIKLLLCFYDPSKGKIELNGNDLREFTLANYRQNLSATFQDYSKFKLSLADNVAVFRPGGNARIKAALKKAGLEALLKDKKIDLNAILNKEFANGTELSGRQW